MILRGVFGMGLLWLCMTQGQALGLAFPKDLSAPCLNSAAGETGNAWRPMVQARLHAMKMELDAAARDASLGRSTSR